jgi:hypothetical protein
MAEGVREGEWTCEEAVRDGGGALGGGGTSGVRGRRGDGDGVRGRRGDGQGKSGR